MWQSSAVVTAKIIKDFYLRVKKFASHRNASIDQGRIRLLVDVTVLAQGIKTGVYRVIDELIRYLVTDNSLDVYFTLTLEEFFRGHNLDLRTNLISYCNKNNINYRFIDSDVDPAFANIDIYFSIFFKVPDNWVQEKRVRKIIFAHDLIALLYPEFFDKEIIQIVKEIYDHIKTDWLILSNSECTKNDILQYQPNINSDNILVLHLGADEKFSTIIDSKVIKDIKIKYDIPVESNYVLSLATLEIRKNLIAVLEGFARYVIIANDQMTCLVLSGMKGWKLDHLQNEISKRTELNGRVILTGFVDENDLFGLYQGASVFVYMSFYEGFGLPPLEAMSSGVPVITSNTSSLPEVVGDAGIMLPPNDTDGLAQALKSILGDKNLRDSYAEKARNRAALFSWKKFGDTFVDAVNRISRCSDPFLSIITICYNEKHIRDTCKSIVEQSYKKFEWIVVDGGSDRETLDVLKEYSANITLLISEKDDGRYDAMNKGIVRAKGKYIIFLNGGDYFYDKNVLDKIFSYSVPIGLSNLFQLKLNSSIIYGEVITKETGLMPHLVWKTGSQKHDIEFFRMNSLPHQATFIKKDLFDKYGLYNVDLKYAGDYEWFMRTMILYEIKSQYLPAIVSVYNFDGVSSSSINADAPHIMETQNIYKHYSKVNNDKPYYCSRANCRINQVSNSSEIFSRDVVSQITQSLTGQSFFSNDIPVVSLPDIKCIYTSELLITLAVPITSLQEDYILLNLLEMVLSKRCPSSSDNTIMPTFLNFSDHSNGFNALVMYLLLIFKMLTQNSLSIERRVSLVRVLLHMREHLIAKLLDQSEILPSPSHEDIDYWLCKEVGIKNVYETYLGRSPDSKEIENWLTNFKNGLTTKEFILITQNSNEAQEYTKYKIQLIEFARQIDTANPPPVSKDRYTMVHKALRFVARHHKYVQQL